MSQSGVGDCQTEPELLQVGQSLEMYKSGVGDSGAAEVERPQVDEAFEMYQLGVGGPVVKEGHSNNIVLVICIDVRSQFCQRMFDCLRSGICISRGRSITTALELGGGAVT